MGGDTGAGRRGLGAAPAGPVCGHGPLREELEALSRKLGISDRVQFLGQLSKTEILEQIDDAHTLVIASRIETFGVVAIEAMARGRPVISTRCGGPEDIVDDLSGVLVPAGNADALAQAMADMVQSFTRYTLAAIRSRAIENYGHAAFLARAENLYRSAA